MTFPRAVVQNVLCPEHERTQRSGRAALLIRAAFARPRWGKALATALTRAII